MHTRTIHPVRTTADGMAGIGRTLHDLRGIRFDENDGGNTNGTPAPTPPAPVGAEPTPPATTPPATSAPAWDGKIESLHPDAQKIIADLRREAGDNRVKAKAESDRVEAILKAAGIKTEEPNPAELLAQSQAAAAQSARELAIYKASANIANPLALLDSASFLASVSGIDPADGPAITAAITAAVAANPNLKAARAAGASSVETPGGTGEQGQITEAQLAQMTPEQISDAFDKGLLKNLL